MTRRALPRAADIGPWLALAAAILSAGMWLGTLQNRIAALEKEQTYYHGNVKEH